MQNRAWRPLLRTALATALGAGLASFYLLPAIYEQGWINLNEVLSPGVRPQDNFLFTTIPDPDHNRFNLLVSTIALAEIGVLVFAIWFSRRSKGRRITASSQHLHYMMRYSSGSVSALPISSPSNLVWQPLP